MAYYQDTLNAYKDPQHKPSVGTQDEGINCLKRAKIIITEQQSTYHCTIRRLCWLSARLHLHSFIELPSEIFLSLSDVDYSAPIKCRIISRTRTEIDVEFIDP